MGKFDVTSNLGKPRNGLERDAVQSFRELESAEKTAGIPELGKRFGQAMIDLHESLEHGDWMPALKRLGITYRKAQYWMDMVKWQNGERPNSPKKKPNDIQLSWDAAIRWLDRLKDKVAVARLKKNDPTGALAFARELSKLAAELRTKDDAKRRNHALVLQRTRPRGGSVAARANKERPHTAGGRR